jgi:hypothetical protein
MFLFFAALLKDALKLGVQQKKITQNKMSFLVTGENYPDPTPRIEVLETVAAADANAQKCKDGEAVTVSYVVSELLRTFFFVFCCFCCFVFFFDDCGNYKGNSCRVWSGV